MSNLNSHTDTDVNSANAARGVWLVKVPKYIAKKWEKAPGNIEVGKLKIVKVPGQKPDVSLSLSESCLALKEPNEGKIPRDRKLNVSTVTHQTLGVFSHTTPSNADTEVPELEKLSLEGRIMHKLEFRPDADDSYMKLKMDEIRKASVPGRKVQQLDKIVHNFKPVSDHKHNIEYNKMKKAEGKNSRDDKDAVLEMLYAAFEKHQYYNIKDLVRITRQPVVYLKKILEDVCNYNSKNPHKNMWELKPEYRHYKKPEQPAEKTTD